MSAYNEMSVNNSTNKICVVVKRVFIFTFANLLHGLPLNAVQYIHVQRRYDKDTIASIILALFFTNKQTR